MESENIMISLPRIYDFEKYLELKTCKETYLAHLFQITI